jgi:ribosomal protein L37E
MSEEGFKCAKCGHQTTRGFLADYSDAAYFVAKWIEGEPVQRTVFGITGNNVETHGRREYNVRTLRCERCGFLELYAV